MKRNEINLTQTPAPSPVGKGKNNAADRVVAQSRARAVHDENVTALPATRLEFSKDEGGKPTLTAIFPKKGGGEPDRVDLTYLLDFPELRDLFAEGFLSWGRSNGQKSRRQHARQLNRFWFRYLRESHLINVALGQIDEQLLAGFNQWLHGPANQPPGKAGQSLNPNTVRKVLGGLRVSFKHTLAGRSLAERVPAGPRGANTKSTPTEVVTPAQLSAIWAAAEKEVLELRDRWARGRRLLEQGRQALAAGKGLERSPRENPCAKTEENLALCLAMLDAVYPATVPDQRTIYAHDRQLAYTVANVFGSVEVTGNLYACARDLVPLILLIALATAFNANTVLTLEWKNIDREVDRLCTRSVKFDVIEESGDVEEDASGDTAPNNESPLLKIKGDKARANRQLLRLLDPTAADPSQASLNLVLDLLRDLTARIRPVALADHGDRLFLMVQERGIKCPKGYASNENSASSDAVWYHSLAKFIKDHDLPRFTLKTLRATLLDLTQLINRGDLEKASQVGDHRNRITTWTHYTSDLVRKLLKEATGEILLTRDRWIDTKGAIDPRKTQENADKACATPGFFCLDPFDSPRPNQKRGRMCDAFGECPNCPLAAARPGNAVDVMWWEALERSIFRSVKTMTANMWQARWAEVAVDLHALIATVPQEVLTESRRFRVELPNVG
jgi:hypothetical protein